VGLGTAAFNMQDIVLEPYGGEILRPGRRRHQCAHRLMAAGSLLAFALAARWLTAAATPTAWPPSARWWACRPLPP
jgi:MFS transporter, BCD family, chlorophyll transporter